MDDPKIIKYGQHFPSRTRRSFQNAKETDGQLFQCKICLEFFSSSEMLNFHMDSTAIHDIHVGDTQRSAKNISHKIDEASAGEVIVRLLESKSALQEGIECDVTKEKKQRTAKRMGAERVSCEICHESFVNHQVFRVHMRRHTGERPYLCTLCESTFTQKSALVGHMATHANEQHKCPECDQVFTQERTLKKHMKFHTGEAKMKRFKKHQEFRIKIPTEVAGNMKCKDRYQCDVCNKHFSTGSQLDTHRRVHTNERPFECGVCGRRFKQKITLIDHEFTHSKNRPYECKKCGSKFKQIRIVRQHTKSGSCDRKLIKKLKETNTQSEEMKTSKQKSEVISTASAPSTTEIEEDSNGDVQNSVQEYHGHVDESEFDTGKVKDNEAGFICEQCGKIFSVKRYLKQHLKTHTNLKPHICSVCGKGFRLKAMLREHMETHSDDKSHKCQTCQKQFKTQRCLQNHIGRNICTGIRPYSCDTCNKSFMYARFLEKHKCLDAPSKVFVCNVCERNFTRHNLFVEHMRTHTGERPLKCDICDKTFAKRALLRNHSFTHFSDKKHECPICRRKYISRSTLKNHMTVHSAEKKYACKLCDKAFKQANSLRTHAKSVHPLDGQGEQRPRAYLCAHCGKMFRHLRWMMKHYCPAVEGIKQFSCNYCTKVFDKKQQLEVHLRIHTGNRPYVCQDCGRCFTQSGSLKDHMVTHTGEKVHVCNICGAKFTRMNSLRRHKLIIHDGVEPFMCGRCGLTFKYQKSLKKHEDMCIEKQGQENLEVVHLPQTEDIPLIPEETTMEQQVHVNENLLGNIQKAINEAGIEIKDNIQYQIVVGENTGEFTVHIGGNT